MSFLMNAYTHYNKKDILEPDQIFFTLYARGCFIDSIRRVISHFLAAVMSIFVVMDGCLSLVSGRLSRSALIKCGLNCECLPDPHRRTNTHQSKVRKPARDTAHRPQTYSISHNQTQRHHFTSTALFTYLHISLKAVKGHIQRPEDHTKM